MPCQCRSTHAVARHGQATFLIRQIHMYVSCGRHTINTWCRTVDICGDSDYLILPPSSVPKKLVLDLSKYRCKMCLDTSIYLDKSRQEVIVLLAYVLIHEYLWKQQASQAPGGPELWATVVDHATDQVANATGGIYELYVIQAPRMSRECCEHSFPKEARPYWHKMVDRYIQTGHPMFNCMSAESNRNKRDGQCKNVTEWNLTETVSNSRVSR